MSENIGQIPGQPPETTGLQGVLIGNVFQMAQLNNLLPRGFKFELIENAWKVDPAQQNLGKRKKTVNKCILFTF